MKVSMKRMLSILLTGFMLMSCALPVFALDERDPVAPTVSQARYAVIRSKTASINISGTTATCYAKLTAQSSVTLSIKMTLQKKSGSTWSNVQSWTSTKTGTSLTMTKTKAVTSGASFRLKVTFTAGSETVSQTVY